MKNNISLIRDLSSDTYEDNMYEIEIMTTNWVKRIAEPSIKLREQINKQPMTLKTMVQIIKNENDYLTLELIEKKVFEKLLIFKNKNKIINKTINTNYKLLKQNVFIFSILVVIFSLLLLFISLRSVIIPINHMLDVTARVAQGDLSVRSKLLTSDEIGLLSQKMDQMLDELEDKRQILENEQKEREDAVNKLKKIINQRDRDD